MVHIETDELWKDGIQLEILQRPAYPIASRRLRTQSGETFTDFATTAYLGLDYNNECRRVILDAVSAMGIHQYISPLYLRSPQQMKLEMELASLIGVEDVNLFSSATLLHVTAIPLLAKRFGAIFVDEYAHASIHTALRLLPRRSSIHKYKHCSVVDLAYKLQALGSHRPPLVISDGIFSMSGGLSPLAQLHETVGRWNGSIYLDDSHGFGVLGHRGKGMHVDNALRRCPVFYVGSFSKALAAPIAFIGGDGKTTADIRCHGLSSMFSGSVSWASISLALCTLAISADNEGQLLRNRLDENREYLAKSLEKCGYRVLAGGGIVAICLENQTQFRVSCVALHRGKVAFNPVMFPAIPKGEYRIRLCLSAAHTRNDIECVLTVLRRLRETSD